MKELIKVISKKLLLWSIVFNTIIGTTSILLMVCKQSIITGIICLVIGFLAVYLKYKMMSKKQKYDKQVRKEKSSICITGS